MPRRRGVSATGDTLHERFAKTRTRSEISFRSLQQLGVIGVDRWARLRVCEGDRTSPCKELAARTRASVVKERKQ